MGEVDFILASRSARREQLLREAGYRFVQADPPFDDPPQPDHADDPQGLAMALALCKARSLIEHVGPGMLIVAADTICVAADGRLLGQPTDEAQARTMLEGFAGRTHEVVSGVALVRAAVAATGGRGPCQEQGFADTVAVRFGPLTRQLIEIYVAGGQWRGKAGGYNLFDRQAAGWPISLAADADATTVVGLPMRKLCQALRAWGVMPRHTRSARTAGRSATR